MSTEQPTTKARRGVDRDGLVWAENTNDGSWSAVAGIKHRTCPSLVVLLAEHGPLNLIDVGTKAPYGLSSNQSTHADSQRLSEPSVRHTKGTRS